MQTEGKRGILRTFVYSICLLTIILIALEIALRITPIHNYFSDDGFGWGKTYNHLYGWDTTPNFRGTYFDWVTDKPGLKDPKYERTIAINSAGFRDDEEITLEKPPNTFRIFTLGDSITFGWGVESIDTFTKQLESRLNESSPKMKFQVINAGIVGFTSYLGVRLFKYKLLQYKPDLIVVAYGGTNYVLASSTDKESLKTGRPILTMVVNIARKFYIYNGLREIVIRANKVDKENKKRRVYPEDFRKELIDLINTARENNTEVVVMTIQSNVLTGQVSKWSMQNRSYSNTPEEVISEHKKMNNVIKEVAGEENVVLADVAEKFNELKRAGRADLFYRPEDAWDDYHPSEAGHRVIADVLFGAISANFHDLGLNMALYSSK